MHAYPKPSVIVRTRLAVGRVPLPLGYDYRFWLVLTEEARGVQGKPGTGGRRVTRVRAAPQSSPGEDTHEALHGRAVQQGPHVAQPAHELCGFDRSAHSEYLQDVHRRLAAREGRKALR